MHIHHIIQLDVTTTDTDLLDALESDLPGADAPETGPEYDGPQRVTDAPDLESGEERLAARVSFVCDPVEVDGTTYDGPTAAADLYDRLTAYALPTGATVRHYKSPVGGVSRQEVAAWYDAHPEEQPTDDDGEPYVPASWSPENHIVDETSFQS